MRKKKSDRRKGCTAASHPPEVAEESHMPPSLIMEKLFATPELFDAILLCLDMAIILTTAQRVSKGWKAHIDTSPTIQLHLFMRAGSHKGLSETRGECVINPLLQKHFGPVLDRDWDDEDTPNVRRHREAYNGRMRFLTVELLENMNLSIADTRNGRVQHERFIREDASWRRMLVSQPPPRKIGYVEYTDNSGPNRCSECPVDVVIIPGGLRMGQLWDTIYRTIWGPYKGQVSSRKASVSWKVGGYEVGEEHQWARIPHSLEERVRGIDLEFVVGHCEQIFNEKFCHTYHNHTIKDGRYKCRDEYWHLMRARKRGSTSWIYKSKGYSEESTLAESNGGEDGSRVRYASLPQIPPTHSAEAA